MVNAWSELLEAAKQALVDLEHCTEHAVSGDALDATILTLEAAIERAEGS